MTEAIYIFVAIGLGYFFLVFVILRLVVPLMGFRQDFPVAELPPDIKQTMTNLESKSSGQLAYLQAVYDLVLDKTLHQWGHTRFKAVIFLPKLFLKDLAQIWRSQSFCYCQAINFVAFSLIVHSKFFKATDVKIRYVFLNFVIHQYLQVRVGEQWLDFDPAGSGIRGRSLGTHAGLFG